MSRVKHLAGFIDTAGIKALVWNSETRATIHWDNGSVGNFEFDSLSARLLTMSYEVDVEFHEKHLEGLREYGYFWLDRERAKHDEDMNDYRAQRKKLRDAGVYGHAEYVGCHYTYRITSSDGKEIGSGGFTIQADDVDGTSVRHW
jgi:hypothetical protein